MSVNIPSGAQGFEATGGCSEVAQLPVVQWELQRSCGPVTRLTRGLVVRRLLLPALDTLRPERGESDPRDFRWFAYLVSDRPMWLASRSKGCA